MIQSPYSTVPRPGSDSQEAGRLLVVDDNVQHLQTLEMLLDSTGHRCAFVHDGPSAIEAASAKEFDLLLTDVRMSPLDGVQTARAIKQIQPEMAVIMMTGFDREDTPLEALRLGAVDYIDKPITDANHFLRLLGHQVRLVHSAKELRATRDRLEAVMRNVDMGVIVADAEGKIEQVNEAARGYVLQGDGNSVARSLSDVSSRIGWQIAIPREGTISSTIHVVGPTGPRLLQIDVTRLENIPGRGAGTVLLLKDLTLLAEQQRAEGWRQMSRAITHGMKTPLGTLRLRMEQLIKSGMVERAATDLETLLAVINELHHRLSDLVDFVKLDLQQVPVDLNVVVARSLKHFEAHCRANTSIEWSPSPEPLMVSVATSAAGLAIENLLANSQESTSEPVRVCVRTRPAEEGGAIIEVEDNGPGIPQELQREIFQHPINSTKPGGTGLGAALVRYIIDQHEGQVEFVSPVKDSRGTLVRMRFPGARAS